jgi:predicted metallopeptidase
MFLRLSNYLVTPLLFQPMAWPDQGGEIVRHIFGTPTIWQGVHGLNPNKPLQPQSNFMIPAKERVRVLI